MSWIRLTLLWSSPLLESNFGHLVGDFSWWCSIPRCRHKLWPDAYEANLLRGLFPPFLYLYLITYAKVSVNKYQSTKELSRYVTFKTSLVRAKLYPVIYVSWFCRKPHQKQLAPTSNLWTTKDENKIACALWNIIDTFGHTENNPQPRGNEYF